MNPRKNKLRKRSVLLATKWYSHDIHRGAARFAKEANWALEPSHRWPLTVENWTGDGVIRISDPPSIQRLVHDKIPVVGIVPALPGDPADMVRILHDDLNIGRLAAEHLIDRGFDKYAFFRAHAADTILREEGFVAALKQAGHPCHIINENGAKIHEGQDPSDRRGALAKMIKKLPTPIGIMAPTDDYAIDVIHAALDAGLLVPEQVAVIGVDNDQLICDLAPTSLSSVDNDQEGLGYEAAKALQRLMDGEPRPKKPILIPPKGVAIRLSTDIVAVDNVFVAQAIRFIWDHYSDVSVSVNSVATAINMPRRSLEIAFAKHLEKTPAQVLRQTRLKHIMRLLVETNHSIETISEMTGVGSPQTLHRILKEVTGMTPREYRLTYVHE